MDAFRRVVVALLFTLWAAGGVPLPGSATVQGDLATGAGQAKATSCRRREGQARRSNEAPARSCLNDGDGGGDLACAASMPTPATPEVGRTLAAATTTLHPRRGPLAGKPRGPPTVA